MLTFLGGLKRDYIWLGMCNDLQSLKASSLGITKNWIGTGTGMGSAGVVVGVKGTDEAEEVSREVTRIMEKRKQISAIATNIRGTISSSIGATIPTVQVTPQPSAEDLTNVDKGDKYILYVVDGEKGVREMKKYEKIRYGKYKDIYSVLAKPEQWNKWLEKDRIKVQISSTMEFKGCVVVIPFPEMGSNIEDRSVNQEISSLLGKDCLVFKTQQNSDVREELKSIQVLHKSVKDPSLKVFISFAGSPSTLVKKYTSSTQVC
eukprot:TRINITY_DN5970_c0_g1_i3.p1 TRINITY_DN5970_c0_g1~~TRINITY_DN5970_c0_g1_i3.p1  ORF type:complete len:274 (-),score=39.94 TRINITY_DN5970_c0_g1_i3:58-840(-)